MIEEATKENQQTEANHHHAYAFPQDQVRLPFMSEHGNIYQSSDRNAEWIFRNKVIPGLSGFVTLEGINPSEDEMRASEFNKIDVDDLVHGNMNLNLNKFFEETEGRRMQYDHPSRRISTSDPISSDNIGISLPEASQPHKISFFKEFLPNMFNHHWADVLSNPTHFYEFESDFPVAKNVENLLYLEDHKNECGNNFESLFSQSYKSTIEKLRTLFTSNSITAEGLIKLIHDSACNLLFEMFNFIKGCDSEYCFGLMKQKTALAKAKNNISKRPDPILTSNLQNFIVPPSKSIIEENKKVDPIVNTEIFEVANNYDFGRKEDRGSAATQQTEMSETETESVLSECTKKTQRKYWSDRELEELDRLSVQYYPNSIPTERLEDFAKKYGRTLNSVQSKISKTKKGRSVKRSDMEAEMISTPPPSQRKYEVSIEKMITTALKQMPGNMGSNSEILEKVRILFGNGQSYFNEESFENSVSQILSSSRNIQKVKGTYGLKSPRYAVHDISHATTTKTRLQFVLSQLPNFRGDIGTIRKLYWDYFQDILKNDKDKLWEKSVVKVLKQSDEFDSNDSKTKYKLVRESP